MYVNLAKNADHNSKLEGKIWSVSKYGLKQDHD